MILINGKNSSIRIEPIRVSIPASTHKIQCKEHYTISFSDMILERYEVVCPKHQRMFRQYHSM